MSVKLEAPLPTIQTISFLPNPQSGDTENLLNQMDLKRSMNGTKYTYVKTTDRRRLTYEFRMTRMKALELRAFILAYASSKIKLTNHKNEVWFVNIVNNPAEFSNIGRSPDAPGGEFYSIQLQFEGIKQ